jgi:hypothetical protein
MDDLNADLNSVAEPHAGLWGYPVIFAKIKTPLNRLSEEQTKHGYV